ncbi:hypothetical protein E2C01_020111 [Portunus trituberculatus]|uniref:Uncharacterized protein n=1 Tax=Portunus trituberculatus TaxID=210409 RepID=A0A5B7E0U9_PORTR|nr:hypothetical protein [Portunus trituberculatus]
MSCLQLVSAPSDDAMGKIGSCLLPDGCCHRTCASPHLRQTAAAAAHSCCWLTSPVHCSNAIGSTRHGWSCRNPRGSRQEWLVPGLWPGLWDREERLP